MPRGALSPFSSTAQPPAAEGAMGGVLTEGSAHITPGDRLYPATGVSSLRKCMYTTEVPSQAPLGIEGANRRWDLGSPLPRAYSYATGHSLPARTTSWPRTLTPAAPAPSPSSSIADRCRRDPGQRRLQLDMTPLFKGPGRRWGAEKAFMPGGHPAPGKEGDACVKGNAGVWL